MIRELVVKHPFLSFIGGLSAMAVLLIILAAIAGMAMGFFSLLYLALTGLASANAVSPLLTITLLFGGIGLVAAAIVLISRPGAEKKVLR